jgi:hypothetical protein
LGLSFLSIYFYPHLVLSCSRGYAYPLPPESIVEENGKNRY